MRELRRIFSKSAENPVRQVGEALRGLPSQILFCRKNRQKRQSDQIEDCQILIRGKVKVSNAEQTARKRDLTVPYTPGTAFTADASRRFPLSSGIIAANKGRNAKIRPRTAGPKELRIAAEHAITIAPVTMLEKCGPLSAEAALPARRSDHTGTLENTESVCTAAETSPAP